MKVLLVLPFRLNLSACFLFHHRFNLLIFHPAEAIRTSRTESYQRWARPAGRSDKQHVNVSTCSHQTGSCFQHRPFPPRA